MIWLIGNKGMLGMDVETMFRERKFDFIAGDVEADITLLDALLEFTKDKSIDWIVNCSAYTAVDRAESDADKSFAVNAQGVENIAIIAKQKKARLIHISTDYVFDGAKRGEYREEDSPGPQGVYGESKLEGERRITKNWDQHFILRTAWLYGLHGANFVHTMLRLFGERDEVRVVNDQWGSPTFTMDLAWMIGEIIARDAKDFGVYHFSNAGRITWYQFAVKIYEIARRLHIIERDVRILPITTADYPTPAKRPANSCLSKEKIQKTFQMTVTSWDLSLERFMSLYKARVSN